MEKNGVADLLPLRDSDKHVLVHLSIPELWEDGIPNIALFNHCQHEVAKSQIGCENGFVINSRYQ